YESLKPPSSPTPSK
ncbi:hypothetical protein Tco_1269493, partial [Tanacetum coccineum]